MVRPATLDPPTHELVVEALLELEDVEECWELACIARYLEAEPRVRMLDLYDRLNFPHRHALNRAHETGWPRPNDLRRIIRICSALRAYIEGGDPLGVAGELAQMDQATLSTDCAKYLGVRPSRIPPDTDIVRFVVSHSRSWPR